MRFAFKAAKEEGNHDRGQAALRRRRLSRLGRQAKACPVVEDYGIDLFEVETAMWPRFGVKAAAVHLKGRGDFANMFLFDIPPGGSTAPQRHLYEDVIYVLEGTGSTQVEFADGRKRSFEWGPRSLFAIPLNAKHRHFNGSGRERALIVSTTDLPLVMNMFHNERFVFDTDFEFAERTGKNEYFAGEGDLITGAAGQPHVGDQFRPRPRGDRAADPGATAAPARTNIMFVLADGIMHAHISEMPVGTYKKGHRHGPGFARDVRQPAHGYSLLWFDGDKDFQRLDWQYGVVFPPADQQFHQHFNAEPASGALSRDRRRRPALSAHAAAAPLAARRQRREERGVAQPQGGRRPDRIRGSGPAHPPALARRDEEERRDAAHAEVFPGRRRDAGDRGGGVGRDRWSLPE